MSLKTRLALVSKEAKLSKWIAATSSHAHHGRSAWDPSDSTVQAAIWPAHNPDQLR
jgi:hypothetical protein